MLDCCTWPLYRSTPSTSVDANSSPMLDCTLVHLAALPLQTLDLARCQQLTDAGLAHLSALSLQTLDLAHATSSRMLGWPTWLLCLSRPSSSSTVT
jgi:hypothetical protein